MPTKISYVEVSSYDWKITAKKFITGMLMAIAPIILLYAINFIENNEFPAEYAIYVPIILGILHALMNILKHYNDTKLVDPDGNPI